MLAMAGTVAAALRGGRVQRATRRQMPSRTTWLAPGGTEARREATMSPWLTRAPAVAMATTLAAGLRRAAVVAAAGSPWPCWQESKCRSRTGRLLRSSRGVAGQEGWDARGKEVDPPPPRLSNQRATQLCASNSRRVGVVRLKSRAGLERDATVWWWWCHQTAWPGWLQCPSRATCKELVLPLLLSSSPHTSCGAQQQLHLAPFRGLPRCIVNGFSKRGQGRILLVGRSGEPWARFRARLQPSRSLYAGSLVKSSSAGRFVSLESCSLGVLLAGDCWR